ncbi:MAG: 50S ribosomal protein L3 [Acidobacteria bacterium]|nr:MAG: 50S ribosomal protein L3 [Acidobacteriota bacterium]
MVEGLIGKKMGMTQIFDDQGNSVPVTVIQAGPCVVVEKKNAEKHGYSAIQLGLVETRKVRVNKPVAGHFKKAGERQNKDIPPTRLIKEFRMREGAETEPEVGDQILVENVFQIGDVVDVSGRSIGKGFQGVIKRHHFRGGAATHGSMFHRAPGSIGASAWPSRVFPGMRAAGRMGGEKVKVRHLEVVDIDSENRLLLVKGSIPGHRNGYVYVTLSR